jgi:multiple sugar transport system substrate-binding protein
MKRQLVLATVAALALCGFLQTPAAAQDAAEKAIEAAKQYSGTTINHMWEAGLMAMLGPNVLGPEWEKLTGIKTNHIEIPYEELFPKAMLEHQAGTGAYDVLTTVPAWIADMVKAGALEPLDPYIEKYGVPGEFDDIVPIFRAGMTYEGKTYGLMVDGDVFVLFYRKDLFENPENQAEFKAKHGYDLAPPKDWKQFREIGQFITDKYAPEIYGAGMIHTGYMHYFFEERFRNYGGKFFDAETMKATVNNEIGVKALTDLVEDIKMQPPGAETWGFGESLSALNAGQIAMTISWPPLGRWSQGIDAQEQALSWVPKTVVADNVGYALVPCGHPQLAAGVLLSLSSNSKNKDAAYLYMQWQASAKESIKNVMKPFGLRDPFRYTHYDDPAYQALWPGAKDYLGVLRKGGEQGLADLSLINTFKYQDATSRAVTAAIGGADPKEALDTLAGEWDAITEAAGVEAQKAAYAEWASKPSAYPQDEACPMGGY